MRCSFWLDRLCKKAGGSGKIGRGDLELTDCPGSDDLPRPWLWSETARLSKLVRGELAGRQARLTRFPGDETFSFRSNGEQCFRTVVPPSGSE